MIKLDRALAAAATVLVVVTTSLHALQRDARSAIQPGTAVISGVVITTDETPQPVRRAIVSLQGGNSSLGRYAITDEDGRFAFESLPAGRFTLTAAKKSFVTIPFEALRAGQPGAPLILQAGQRVGDVKLRLARGAVVTGTVRDDSGEPISGLDVRVEATTAIGTARPVSFMSMTDDQGVYRVFGLPAGSYLVSTRPRVTGTADLVAPSDAEVDAALKELQARRVAPLQPAAAPGAIRNIPSRAPARPVDFVPVFHPSVFTPEEAAVIGVRAGEERAGVDVTVRMLSTSAITGRIMNMTGRAASEIEVTLSKAGQTGLPVGAFRTIVRPDGSFRIGGVTPGKYLLAVRAMSAALLEASLGKPVTADRAAGATCAFAAADLHVIGDDINDLFLTLRPCLKIDGRMEFASAGGAPPGPAPGVVVALQPIAGSKLPAYVPLRMPAMVKADGTFALGEFGDVLPGTYQLSVTVQGSEVGKGWWLQSAKANDRDVLDSPLQIGTEDVSPIVVVLTFGDRHTSLAGTLEIPAQRLPVEYTVVVFPTNRNWWSAPFRRVKAARAAPTGEYLVQDLPPGDYYLAALSDLAPDEWRDREFLDLVLPAAIRLTIAPGEQKRQNLRIGRTPLP